MICSGPKGTMCCLCTWKDVASCHPLVGESGLVHSDLHTLDYSMNTRWYAFSMLFWIGDEWWEVHLTWKTIQNAFSHILYTSRHINHVLSILQNVEDHESHARCMYRRTVLHKGKVRSMREWTYKTPHQKWVILFISRVPIFLFFYNWINRPANQKQLTLYIGYQLSLDGRPMEHL